MKQPTLGDTARKNIKDTLKKKQRLAIVEILDVLDKNGLYTEGLELVSQKYHADKNDLNLWYHWIYNRKIK